MVVAIAAKLLHLGALLDACAVPHLDHEFGEAPGEVVVDDAHAADGLDGAMEELAAALEVDFSCKEGTE